jgi:hypothetical protein
MTFAERSVCYLFYFVPTYKGLPPQEVNPVGHDSKAMRTLNKENQNKNRGTQLYSTLTDRSVQH